MSFLYIDPWRLREDIRVERRGAMSVDQVDRRLRKFAKQREPITTNTASATAANSLPIGLPPLNVLRNELATLGELLPTDGRSNK